MNIIYFIFFSERAPPVPGVHGQRVAEAAERQHNERVAEGLRNAAVANGPNNAGTAGRRRNLIRHDARDVEQAREIVERSRVLADRIIRRGWQQYNNTITRARATVARRVALAREADIRGIIACRANRIRVINRSQRVAADIINRARRRAARDIAHSRRIAAQIIQRAREQNAQRTAVRGRRGRAGAGGHRAARQQVRDEELSE